MIKAIGLIDITALKRAVASIPWKAREKGPAIGCPSFRSTDDGWSNIRSVIDAYIDRILEYACHDKGGEIGEVVISKMPPGKLILPHIDARVPDYSRLLRIHLPVFTNNLTYMIYPETNPIQIYNMKAGSIYTVKVLAGHMVVNAGDTDRTHLYFDYFRPVLM